MAIHWKVQFKSISGVAYTVNIYDSSYSGSAVQLTGAAQPFSTTEETSDDWFKPVRTQSGYLRIIDTGKDNAGNPFDWHNLIPANEKSRPVTLTHVENNTTVTDWQGYLQPKTFSGQMFSGVEEREFPIMCALSALSGDYISSADNGMVNFAYLLDTILSATGYSWSSVYFTGANVSAWLKLRICWNNFIEVNDHVRKAKYTYLELLEEVCKYWGWTCRTRRNQIFFVSPDDNLSTAFIRTTPSAIHTTATNGSTITYTTETWGTLNTNRDIYASVNNDIEILRGIKKAKVTANFGLLNKLFKIPFDDIKKDLEKNPPTSYIEQGGVYTFSKSALPDQAIFTDVTVYDQEQSYWEPSWFTISQIYSGDLRYLHNYSFNCYSYLLGGQGVTTPPDVWRRIACQYEYCFTGGVIYIKASINAHAGGRLQCKLNIGDVWWTGSAWSQTETTFNIEFGNEQDPYQGGSNLPIITTRDRDDPYPSYDGYGIEIPTNIAVVGKLTFYMSLVSVYDGTEPGGGIQAGFSSFEIGFLRRNDISVDQDSTNNVFEDVTNMDFRDEVDVTTIFGGDDGNNFGNGLLLETNDTYCTGVLYTYSSGAAYELPEKHLLDRIIARGSNVKKKENVEIRSDLIPALSPTYKCNTPNITGGYPISISREWRDDISKIIIQEI